MQLTYNNNQKERLDKFLIEHLPASTAKRGETDLSRSQIQKMIKDGLILVNGKKVSVHNFLKVNDVITIKQPSNLPITNHQSPITISETNDYLVIEKPAGLIVHSAEGIKEPTLVDWLTNKYPAIKQVGDNPLRPGLVHRLDKNVSGLMVIAKTPAMFSNLKKQFQNHLVKKEYLALVNGKTNFEHKVIDFPLERSTTTGKIVAKPIGSTGKSAITEVAVLKKFSNYTYLSVDLKTGRTHQIRAHLTALGYPLVGDKLYKNNKLKNKIELNRIFLHAHKLSFANLDGVQQSFTSALPKDLENIINNLK